MDLRSLISKIDRLNEAEDPAAVIQKYTDMGKSPTAQMPAFIDPKDGKVKYMDAGNARMGGEPQVKVMPSDWIKKYAPDLADALAAQGGNKQGYGAQDQGSFLGFKYNNGTKVNTAQAGADARGNAAIAADTTALKDLIGKLQSAMMSESFKFKGAIANSLVESFGYKLDEAEPGLKLPANAGDIMGKPAGADKQELVKQITAITGKYADATNLPPEFEKLLQTASDLINKASAAPAATPASGPSAQDVTAAASGAGEQVGKKLQRYKDLLAKAKGAKATATAAAPTTAAPGQSATPNPLAQDNATTDIKKIVARESLAESIARMRNRLEVIESRVDEADPFSFGKSLYTGAKGLYQAAKTGLSGAPVATGKLTKAGAAQMTGQTSQKFAKQLATMPKSQQATYAAAKAIKNNPIKTAIGATAAGAGVGYGLSSKPGEAPTPNPTPTPTPTPSPRPTPGPTPTPGSSNLTPEEMKELDTLAQSFGDSEDPEIAGLNKEYSDVKNAMLNQK